jgi:probable F420-dependent oxidoreductase
LGNLGSMTRARAFRFGAGAPSAGSREEWEEKARRTEGLGYSVLHMPDHLGTQLAPVPALLAAALATKELRVATLVLDNDFRQPVVLAKEIATLDLLSEGRLEVGLGAGWHRPEYEAAGLSFDPPGARVSRLEEAVRLMKGLWGEGPVTFEGKTYSTRDQEGWPKPCQRPRPPLGIGGGGRRVLSIAAREADIVCIGPRFVDGIADRGSLSEATLAEQVGWIREAAGERLDVLELNLLLQGVWISDSPTATAEELSVRFELPSKEVLATPHLLVGSLDGVVERLQSLRERFGISYFSVHEPYRDAMAPVVQRLAGA